MSSLRIAVNIVAFYAAWFGAAYAAANGYGPVAAAACLGAVVLHLALCTDRWRELCLAVAAAGLGLCAETALIAAGLTSFSARDLPAPFPPLWVLALWAAFASLLNVSLRWLNSRLVLAAGLGFAGGPLSYWAGARLGAISLAEPESVTLLAAGVVWAFALPLLMVVARCVSPFAGKHDHDG